MPTLTSYWQEAARALDDLGLHTVASATGTTATAATLVNTATGASTSRLDGRYLYIVSGFAIGTGATVKDGGLAPATGQLTIAETAWPTTPHAGDVLATTGLFPVAPGISADATDWHSLTNQALSMIDRGDILSVPVTTAADHPLTTWATWITEDRVEKLPDGSLDVRGPARAAGAAPLPAPFRHWEYVDDGDAPKLRTPVRFASPSGSLEVRARRPSDTWIRTSGVWGESAIGLVNETDEALPPVRDVVKVILMLAYRDLMNRQPGAPSDPSIMRKYALAASEAQGVRGFNVGQPAAQPQAAQVAQPQLAVQPAAAAGRAPARGAA